MKKILLSLSIVTGLLLPSSTIMPVKQSEIKKLTTELEDEGYQSDVSLIDSKPEPLDTLVEELSAARRLDNTSALQANLQTRIALELLEKLDAMKKASEKKDKPKDETLDFTESMVTPLKDAMKIFMYYGVGLPLCVLGWYYLAYKVVYKQLEIPQKAGHELANAGVQIIGDMAKASGEILKDAAMAGAQAGSDAAKLMLQEFKASLPTAGDAANFTKEAVSAGAQAGLDVANVIIKNVQENLPTAEQATDFVKETAAVGAQAGLDVANVIIKNVQENLPTAEQAANFTKEAVSAGAQAGLDVANVIIKNVQENLPTAEQTTDFVKKTTFAGTRMSLDAVGAVGGQIVETAGDVGAAIGTAMYDKAAEVAGPNPVISYLDWTFCGGNHVLQHYFGYPH